MPKTTLIVGAGPAGAALAFLLARRGLDVTLVERERDFSRVFRGEALMPCGLDALAQMGLLERMLELPGVRLESWDVFLDQTPVMHIPEQIAELGDRAVRIISQPAFLEALIEAASQYPGFHFESGATVRGLLYKTDGETGTRVCSGVRVAGTDSERPLHADLVVGADGRASVVRKRSSLELKLLPESYDIVWLKLAAPEELVGRAPIHVYASGPEAALGYISWDGRWQIAWMLPKGTWAAVREQPWLEQCAKLMPESLGAHLLNERERLDGPFILDVVVGRCANWSEPGLLLLGDAAHPMSPVRAQGINMALRDAIVAANHLVPALTEDAPLDAALHAIQREREREIIPVQKLQLSEVRGQRWARERPWLMAPMLRYVVPLIANRPWIAKLWLRQQRSLRIGVREVTLQV